MVSAAAACLPLFFTGFRIARWEGALFLAVYAAYLAFAILDAAGHGTLAPFSGALLAFCLPLIAAAGGGIVIRSLGRKRKEGQCTLSGGSARGGEDAARTLNPDGGWPRRA